MRGRGRRGECNEGRREGGREGRGEEHAKQKEAAGAGGRKKPAGGVQALRTVQLNGDYSGSGSTRAATATPMAMTRTEDTALSVPVFVGGEGRGERGVRALAGSLTFCGLGFPGLRSAALPWALPLLPHQDILGSSAAPARCTGRAAGQCKTSRI